MSGPTDINLKIEHARDAVMRRKADSRTRLQANPQRQSEPVQLVDSIDHQHEPTLVSDKQQFFVLCELEIDVPLKLLPRPLEHPNRTRDNEAYVTQSVYVREEDEHGSAHEIYGQEPALQPGVCGQDHPSALDRHGHRVQNVRDDVRFRRLDAPFERQADAMGEHVRRHGFDVFRDDV